MKTKVVGITFKSDAQPELFATLRPTGVASLIPEDDNPHDPYAVGVWWNDVQLGFLPARYKDKKSIGSPEQMAVRERGITTAEIIDYSYCDPDTGSFNDAHVGVLQRVGLEMAIDQAVVQGASGSHGTEYMRVTKFIKYFNMFGDNNGLIFWNLRQLIEGYTWEQANTEVLPYIEECNTTPWLDKTAVDGISMHDAIFNDLHPDLRPDAPLPMGWDDAKKKFDFDMCYGEARFYDDTLGVSGQPDFVGYITHPKTGERVLAVVDWKSSKKVSPTHLLQASIYAKNAQWEGKEPTHVLIVSFNEEANKRGWTFRCIDKKAIEHNYSAACKLRELIDMIGVVPKGSTMTRKELEEC